MTFAIDLVLLQERAALRLATSETVATLLPEEGSKVAGVATVAEGEIVQQPVFVARFDRLRRWGYTAEEATELAERLARRDRESDDRVSCSDCRYARSRVCLNHKRAALGGREVGLGWAKLLQRCPGFDSIDESGDAK